MTPRPIRGPEDPHEWLDWAMDQGETEYRYLMGYRVAVTRELLDGCVRNDGTRRGT